MLPDIEKTLHVDLLNLVKLSRNNSLLIMSHRFYQIEYMFYQYLHYTTRSLYMLPAVNRCYRISVRLCACIFPIQSNFTFPLEMISFLFINTLPTTAQAPGAVCSDSSSCTKLVLSAGRVMNLKIVVTKANRISISKE